MKLVSSILLLFILAVSLAACQGTPAPAVSPPQEPAALAAPTVPAPAEGKTTVKGRVISEQSKQPMPGVPVRLAEVVRDGDAGAYILDVAFSPGAITDEGGYFVISDVDAMEYVIVVGDVYDLYMVIQDSQRTAKVWDAPHDQVLDTGTLEVTLGN
jgi:hypothetical protein